jgi:hypothetical protein
MDARFYTSEEIDIQRLANDLENVYRTKGYQTQQFGNRDQTLVQLKKGGDFEAIIGMQTALSLTIQRTSGGVLAMIGQQRWLDKAAVGAVGIIAMPVLWPLAITAGVGAVRQASLANEVLNIVDGLVRQQQPGVQVGPIPPTLLPQVQQQWAPPSGPPPGTPPYVPPYTPPGPPPGSPSYVPPYVPPAPQASPPGPAAPPRLRCPDCHTPYEPGDTFCTGCGRSLKLLCPNCKAELKPDVAFCPKCGASTFQARTQTVRPAPAAPAPTPAPAAQGRPVPPPASAPASQPKPPAVQPYVPAAPASPPVVPKPTVTFIPAASQGTAADAAAPTVAQTPPAATPASETIPVYQPRTPPAVPPPPGPPQPIKARPLARPVSDPDAPWGRLIFQDGRDLPLVGERLVVGRYDHDLGGLKPDIDLSAMEQADTVSRVHAVLEHIGSTFTLTDLNSTNSTRVNGRRLEPDRATPISDGDTLHFGKVSCTFKKQ